LGGCTRGRKPCTTTGGHQTSECRQQAIHAKFRTPNKLIMGNPFLKILKQTDFVQDSPTIHRDLMYHIMREREISSDELRRLQATPRVASTHTGGRAAATSHTFDLQHRPLCCHCLSHSIESLNCLPFLGYFLGLGGAARTALPQPAAATTVALPSGMACRELNDALNEDTDAARALSPHENGQDRSTKDHRLRTAFEEVPL